MGKPPELGTDYVAMKLAQAQAQPINSEAYNRILDSLFDDTKITDQVELMSLRAACLELAQYVHGGYSESQYLKIVNEVLTRNELSTVGAIGHTNRKRAMGIANNISSMECSDKLLGTRGRPTRGYQPPPATNSLDGYSLFSDDGIKVSK